MPVTCLVVGCGSRSNRDSVRFYTVPGVLNYVLLTKKNELSKRRRSLWITAIKRDDLTESILKNQRVCSRHFITGRPAALEDENHPDWVPSQNMGHMSQKVHKRHEDIQRKERLERRKRMRVEQHAGCVMDTSDDENLNPETSSLTDNRMETMNVQSEQIAFAAKKLAELEKKVETSPFGLRCDPKNDKKWRYYTGFTFIFIELIIFKSIESNIAITSTTALSSYNQLLLTLIKLRLNLHFRDLAYRFQISCTSASTYFENIVDILYKKFKSVIIWPDRSVIKKTMPTCFKEAFHEKTSVIIDCFEVFIEKPSSLQTQVQCWSNYKHHLTIKFLIGMTPQGTVSFISKAWGGRASDKQILEGSDFLDHILPGDIVLADRGFLVKETLGVLQAKLVIPAFTKGKNQLHPLEVEETRKIAHVRIHVERVIGMLKNKFNIFRDTIPISMINKRNEAEDLNLLDKIVTVCCAFINISPPIIPL